MTAPETPEIKVIVSESSYASLSLMASQIYRLPLLKYPLAFCTGLWGRALFGMKLSQVAPAESVKRLNVPVLIIHSKKDEVIPFSHALLIQEGLRNNSKAEFWFQEGLLHGQFSDVYEDKVERFFEKHLTILAGGEPISAVE